MNTPSCCLDKTSCALKIIFLILFLGVLPEARAQEPTISSFAPNFGPVGTVVSITGTNFGASAKVFFGGVEATAAIISSTQIDATVPFGASFQPITVTTGNLTAYSKVPFRVTFGDSGIMTSCAFSTKRDIATDAGPYSVTTGDLDSDSKPDVVTANFASNTFSVLKGQGMANTLGSPFPSFSAKTDFVTGPGPRAIALGDIDNDGKPDVVVANFTNNTLSVYRNTSPSSGVLSFAPKVDFATGTGPFKVAIRDLDGDGKSDVVVVNQISGAGLSVLHNVSTSGTINSGSFETKVDFATGANPEDIDITDIDGDSKPDLLTTNTADNTFSVLLNTSIKGTINSASFAANVDIVSGIGTSIPKNLSVGDLDLDGKQDVAVVNSGNDAVAVFKNISTVGNVSFAAHTDVSTGAGSYDIALTDLDGNGRIDLAVSLQDASVMGVLTIRNNTFGTFAFNSFQLFSTDVAPWQLVIEDLDADGRPDIAAADFDANAVAVFRNQASSLPNTLFAVNYSPASGPEGSLVTISGGPFSTFNNNNVVFFNDKRATVFSSSSTTITVTVPLGATTGFLTVTVGCQTAGNIVPFTVTPSSCVPVTQRNALISLYNDTGGNSWTNKTNWLAGDESTWYGVTVQGCAVTKLLLPTNNVTGALPAYLENLTNLKELDLSNNHLAGFIPGELANLDVLTSLNLSKNELYGEIPDEFEDFGENDQLLTLDLSHNSLYGEIPPELGEIESLVTLNLGTNSLYGVLPAFLQNLTNLQYFNIEHNGFEDDIPSSYGNMSSLRNFYAAYNELENVPSSFGAIATLQIVDLSHNELVSIPTFTSTVMTRLAVEFNLLDFADLEPNQGHPGFTNDPQAKLPPGGLLSFTPGGTLSIPFITQGTANSYQWYNSNGLIPGATSATFSKSGMTVSDAGYYYVRISSSIVTGVVLQSLPYLALTDPCGGAPRTSGTLDTSFDVHVGGSSYTTAVEMQSSGKIIVSMSDNLINSSGVRGLLRLNSDGTIDNTFDANDQYTPPAKKMIVQPDDKILLPDVIGSYGQVLRLNADGSDDASFNTNSPQYYSGNIYALALQPDNKIVYSYQYYMSSQQIGRLNTDGTPDNTFTGPTDISAEAIKVKSDGRILVGGYSGLTQLSSSGVIDTGFNPTFDDAVFDIAVQPDGKIIVVGQFFIVNGLPQQGIVRLNADGTTDTSFKLIGLSQDPAGPHNEMAPTKIYLQSDGKVLIAGHFNSVNGASRINLVRLNNDGSIDCNFSPGSGTDDVIDDIALQTDGKILLTGGFTTYDGVTRPVIVRVNNGSTEITITQQPADATVCAGATATFNTNATGTTGITYQWQFSPNSPINFTDIANSANYSGANTKTLSVNTTGSFGVGRYRCRINGTAASEKITNDEGLFVNAAPTAPIAVNASSCNAASLSVGATGGVNGQYRWYTAATGGTAIAGETNQTYVTPVLSVTTIYYASINNGTCESTRTPVTASITIVAKPVVTTSNCNASGATLTAPAGFTTYAWSNGSTSQQINVTVAGSYSVVVTNSNGCSSVSSDATTFASDFCNQPPAIQPTVLETVIESTITLSLKGLITDVDNNVDFATLKITSQPVSGAVASIDPSGQLFLDYGGRSFSGDDHLTVEVCDSKGKCAQQVITVKVSGDIIVYNGISPNGDNLNDYWQIKYIDVLTDTKNNKVSLFNRWGDSVFETENYDNKDRVFKGFGKGGSELPSGVYFYKIEFISGREMMTGYISVKR